MFISEQKNINLILTFVVCVALQSCQTTQSRTTLNKKPENKSAVTSSIEHKNSTSETTDDGSDVEASPITNDEAVTGNADSQNHSAVQVQVPEIPKIGIILGPGGARSFAYISFLQELQKNKIPVQSIGGLEFGAPMAALFAWKGFANDVEWQMMKLKTENFPKKWIDPHSLTSFLNLVFQKSKVEDLKLPYGCLAHNLDKNQIFVMSRGPLAQLLPYCWPYPPVMKPYSNNVSGLRDVKMLSDYLRSQGANYIVYVNVLGTTRGASLIGDKDSTENIMWSEIATTAAKSPAGIDYLLNLNVENYGIMDFDKKREIFQKGQDSARKSVQALARKLNL